VRYLGAGAGLVLAVWGLCVALRSSARPATLAALYLLCSGMHWGGAPGVGSDAWNSAFLATYVVVAVVLAGSLFLDLAVLFPEPLPAFHSRRWRLVFYTPAAVGGLLPLALASRPADSRLLTVLGLLLSVGGLLTLAGAAIWIWRAAPWGQRRPRQEVGCIAGVMVAAWLPGVVAGAAGLAAPWGGLLDLLNAATPAVLGWVVVHDSRSVGATDAGGSPEPSQGATDDEEADRQRREPGQKEPRGARS